MRAVLLKQLPGRIKTGTAETMQLFDRLCLNSDAERAALLELQY